MITAAIWCLLIAWPITAKGSGARSVETLAAIAGAILLTMVVNR